MSKVCFKSLPFELVRDAFFLQYLNLAADLLVIFYIALGCWRAAPVTRLLLRSAQNHLDLETNQTMGHFFENIFHALVGLFAGIAMLDRLGVPVSGLLTGAGVAGLAVHTEQPDCRHHAGVGAALRHRGLHRAGRLRGHR